MFTWFLESIIQNIKYIFIYNNIKKFLNVPDIKYTELVDKDNNLSVFEDSDDFYSDSDNYYDESLWEVEYLDNSEKYN